MPQISKIKRIKKICSICHPSDSELAKQICVKKQTSKFKKKSVEICEICGKKIKQ